MGIGPDGPYPPLYIRIENQIIACILPFPRYTGDGMEPAFSPVKRMKQADVSVADKKVISVGWVKMNTVTGSHIQAAA